MAFGFDDFAKFFDPVSDALGTSGRQGMGLLQQKPEDLQRAALIAALVASGVGAAGAGAVVPAAAGESAALVTAPLVETAAVVPEASGILTATTDAAAQEALGDQTLANAMNGIKYSPELEASLEPTASGIQTVA